jgi:hypothetical protein
MVSDDLDTLPFLEVSRSSYKVSDFVSWQRAGSLELSPSFQRRSVWRPIEKSYLIDTVVRGFPMPVIFLRDLPGDLDNLEPVRQVVDGQQRIRTLLTFVAPHLVQDFDEERDPFTVRQSHNAELAGLGFGQMPKYIQRRILSYQFSVDTFPSETDDREILQIFARMNSTGVKLTDQELRNAEFIGEFKNTMYRLAAEQLGRWRDWGVFSEQNIARMDEVELTSELVLLEMSGIQGRSKAALDRAYERNEEAFPTGFEVARRFQYVMDSIEAKLGPVIRELELNRRALFYPLFAVFYDAHFGLKTDLSDGRRTRPIEDRTVTRVKRSARRILERSAPAEILEQLARRTTHVSTRTSVFEYLRS